MIVILLLLAGTGLSQLLDNGTIMMPLKMWLGSKNNWLGNKLLNILACHACSGFYAGVLVYLFFLCSPYLDFLLWGLAVSFVANIFVFLMNRNYNNLLDTKLKSGVPPSSRA
jgi:hypothetical protein